MDRPTAIGLDLAKGVFQAHGADAQGRAVVRRQLRRSQVLAFSERLCLCLVGMEACSGAHPWAWELTGLGREVRLMPPAYVKPCVKRGKTDGERRPWPQWGRESASNERRGGDLRGSGAGRAAIGRSSGPIEGGRRASAQTRPTMRFVPVKSAERQAALLDHKARDFRVRQRTRTANAIRAHLGEFGTVVARGIHDMNLLL
jgi:transposase